jgi:hypothetical protein
MKYQREQLVLRPRVVGAWTKTCQKMEKRKAEEFLPKKRQKLWRDLPSPPSVGSLVIKIPRLPMIDISHKQIEQSFIEKQKKMTPKTPVEKLPLLLAPSPSKDTVQPTPELQTMLDNEKAIRGVFGKQEIRTEVLEMISFLNNRLRFLPETYYMSVHLFDAYVSQVSIRMKKQYFYVALGCVYICGKLVEELSEPKIEDILRFSKIEITGKKLKVLKN